MPDQTNPLLAPWTAPFEAPPFEQIKSEHYRPAYDAALAAHVKEIDTIAGSGAAPDFANTVEAMERAGTLLDRVSGVFDNLAGAHTNDAIEEIERELAPVIARHFS